VGIYSNGDLPQGETGFNLAPEEWRERQFLEYHPGDASSGGLLFQVLNLKHFNRFAFIPL
jgi:hypothetical protein